jgi:translation elongation factor P/translation initiation factor 5A
MVFIGEEWIDQKIKCLPRLYDRVVEIARFEKFNVDDVEFMKPGKGRAIYRLRLRNMLNGNVLEKTYHSAEKVEEASIAVNEMQYLYREGTHYHFMDNRNYEQIIIDEETLGDAKNFLTENLNIKVYLMRMFLVLLNIS